MIFFVLLFLCIIACIISQKNAKLQKYLAILFLIVMTILVGVRDPSVGIDSERYAEKLGFVKDASLSFEPLFQLSINFVNETWGTVLAWFMYISIITYFFYGLSIIKFSVNPILSVLVFMVSFVHVFPDTMNNLRQGMAIMFLLLSYVMAAKKKYVFSIPLFLIAAGFHTSSFFVLPFYFISLHDFSRRTIVSTLIITFILGFFSSHFLNLTSYLSSFSFASEFIMEGLDKFSGYTEDSEKVLNWAGIITTMLPINVLCFLLIPDANEDHSYKYLFNFYFWGVIIGNLIVGSIAFGARFMVLFLIVESILVASKYKKSKYLRLFVIFMVLYYIDYLITISNSSMQGMIIPYKINPEFLKLL